MNKVRYSVIIPTFNEEKFLPNLLDSLTHQGRKDLEVIVVDGNSKDKTLATARSFQGKVPNLTLLVSQKRGPSVQRNAGATAARGEWLVFVDADSALLPYALDRMDTFIAEKRPTLFTSWFMPDTDVTADALLTLMINLVIEGALLLRRPVAPGPLTAVERSAFEEVGGYDEAIEFGEDYDLTQKICRRGVPLLILRETLYVYSLRRIRYQGRLKVAQSYARAILSVLLTKRPPRSMPDYILGGHLYSQRKPIQRSVMRRFEVQLKKLMKELFE